MTEQPGSRTSAPRVRVTLERAELIASRRAGAHQHLTLVAPQVAEFARAGQFLTVAVGGASSAALRRRSLWIHRVSPSSTYGGTVEVIVSATGTGTRWLAGLSVHDPVDVVGPLGRPFPLPTEPVACLLVGSGHGSAPLLWLAAELRERGCPVEMVLTAPDEEHLFGVVEARRTCDGVAVTTDEGGSDGLSAGPDPVGAAVADALGRTGASVVYACGPTGLLRAITAIAQARGVVAQVALESPMACGTGVCQSCVLPVVGADGRTRMVRSCVEGPVFRGDRIRWDAEDVDGWQVPTDATGALKER